MNKKSNPPNRFFDKSLFKFILVGIANTLFGSAIMFVFYNVFHFGYWISTISNYVFGSILSFFLNKFYTFKSKRFSIKETFLFILNVLVCYLIAYGGAKRLAVIAFKNLSETLQNNVAMLCGMIVFIFLNYIGQKFIVFRNKKDE